MTFDVTVIQAMMADGDGKDPKAAKKGYPEKEQSKEEPDVPEDAAAKKKKKSKKKKDTPAAAQEGEAAPASAEAVAPSPDAAPDGEEDVADAGAKKKSKKKKKAGGDGGALAKAFIPEQDNSALRGLKNWPAVPSSRQSPAFDVPVSEQYPDGDFPSGVSLS